jgi:serine phosphatase RsbU (regulator of sigma subunit)
MAGQQQDITIRSNKRMLILTLIIFVFFTYELLENIYDVIVEDSFSFGFAFDIVLYAALASVTAFVALYAAKRIKDKAPGLVINKLGIIDNSGFVSAGTVFWADVEEVNSNKVIFSDCIIIRVKNPSRYIKNQKNPFKRIWLSMENRYYGSPVNISVSGLKFKFKDLFRIVQQNYLASQVESRTYEIRREKDIIQREKKELVDSINYAKRIQSALLPSHEVIEQHLGDCFILFLPKDIVSGDFYWVETVDEWVFFAVCDCTGHGVPGALISIVCHNALNRAVKEYKIVQPSLILDKTAELIIESIGLGGDVKDGMDASVCAFNKNTRELFWSGANIPMWIAREGTFYELLEFKPDKQALGLVENRSSFTNHKIEIQKNDLIYLCSDGFADQFGGPKGKKLTRKKFKELLLLQRRIPLQEQGKNLLKFHTEYKNGGDQIDDILVLGVRIEK